MKSMSLDHDPTRLNRIMISSLCLSMIFSENRYPLFRIMLYCRRRSPPAIALGYARQVVARAPEALISRHSASGTALARLNKDMERPIAVDTGIHALILRAMFKQVF